MSDSVKIDLTEKWLNHLRKYRGKNNSGVLQWPEASLQNSNSVSVQKREKNVE